MSELDTFITDWTRQIMREKYGQLESQISNAIAEHKCRPDDIMIEHSYMDGEFRVRLITDEERWLDWQSQNHGWERSAHQPNG